MALDSEIVIDEKKVHEVLARFALPDTIERVETDFGRDSTSDPAVWLTFHVRDGVIDQDELKRLTKFLSDVTSALLQADIAAFPYTKLVQAA